MTAAVDMSKNLMGPPAWAPISTARPARRLSVLRTSWPRQRRARRQTTRDTSTMPPTSMTEYLLSADRVASCIGQRQARHSLEPSMAIMIKFPPSRTDRFPATPWNPRAAVTPGERLFKTSATPSKTVIAALRDEYADTPCNVGAMTPTRKIDAAR